MKKPTVLKTKLAVAAVCAAAVAGCKTPAPTPAPKHLGNIRARARANVLGQAHSVVVAVVAHPGAGGDCLPTDM